MSRHSYFFVTLWAWPIALGLLTASGLISALVSDAVGDQWAWFALGTPIAVMAWFGWPRALSKVDANPSPNHSSLQIIDLHP